MHHHTHQGVLCVDHTMPHPPPPTPSPHSHTHHMAHTHGISHTATMVLAIAHHAVHSHTQLMPHTHHTGDRPRPSTPLAVAFREPPPPRWSCPFALLSSSLLVHQPLFSLSQACTHTPLMCSSPPPCHPSRVCVVCVLWGWTAPSTTVVVKHATHTLVDHCVDGSHHPTLHPPSTLTPFCAFATTNHHAIPLLQPHHHTTRPLCSSTAHSSASHTHMVWMACAFVAALTSCVWCVWMACTSHHIVHTHSHNHCGFAHHHTTTLWCVCAWKHVPHGHAQPPTTHLLGVVFSLSSQVRAIKPFAIHPVCVVDWWLACVGVATCVSACVLVGCVAFHHTVCRVCLHALIHLCHHTLLLLCWCWWWWW